MIFTAITDNLIRFTKKIIHHPSAINIIEIGEFVGMQYIPG